MGHEDNITEQTFSHLAEHNNTSVNETKRMVYHLLEKQLTKKEAVKEDPHLTEMYEKAAKAWGQSVEEARKNTYQLLKQELKIKS